MSTLHSHPTRDRNLETVTAFKGSKKLNVEDSKALIINSAEFWSWEARGKYIDV